MMEATMQCQQLQLKFKGNRTYLHGTDMFNQTLDWLSSVRDDVRDIDFAFHRLATRQLEAVAGPAPAGVTPVAVCAYTCEDGREWAHVVETDEEVNGRYPYPEDEIVAQMAIDLVSRRGVLRGDSGFSDIEVWVAMTKALHLAAFPDLPGKWLFVRCRCPEYTRHSTGERMVAITGVLSAKLTRSETYVDGRRTGEIFFSMV
jgi:hypothetical protein